MRCYSMISNRTLRSLAWVLSLCLLIVFAAACGQADNGKNQSAADGWDKIKKRGTLVIGTSGTLYASSFHEEGSNKLTGYDVEVAREIAKRLGLKAQFKEMDFDAMLPSIKSGKIDIAANDIGVTAERKKSFAFSVPYKYSYGTAIVRKKDLSGIKSLKDLKGKKAAGAATSIYSQIAKKFGATIVTYGNVTNDVYLKDVALGRTDVILNDYYLQKLALEAYPNLNLVIHPNIKYNLSATAIVMGKNQTELQKHINKALRAMKQDGTLAKLAKKFYHANVSKKPHMHIQEIKLDK